MGEKKCGWRGVGAFRYTVGGSTSDKTAVFRTRKKKWKKVCFLYRT
jgi:hypothetical protein